jgi:hypothetical protein
MVTVGILAALAGYTLAYYGFDIITGGNDSLWSVFWPGAYKATPRDGGGSTGAGQTSGKSTPFAQPFGSNPTAAKK